MNRSDIQLLYDYNYWTNHLMLAQAAKVSKEQFSQPTNFSWGSLHKTLLHTMDTEYGWRVFIQDGTVAPDFSVEDYPTLDSIVAYWKKEEAEMRAYLDSLSDDDMNSVIRREINGKKIERVLWHALIHVVNHGTQHRSECAAMLTDFGHSPGDIDFVVFLRQRE